MLKLMQWTLLNIFFTIVAIHVVAVKHNHFIEHLDRQVKHLEGVVSMSTQDAVNAIVAQLGKAKDELVAQIADLQGQVAAAGVAEQVDLSGLSAVAQALDDIVPDAAPVEPVVEPVADPAPEV